MKKKSYFYFGYISSLIITTVLHGYMRDSVSGLVTFLMVAGVIVTAVLVMIKDDDDD